MTIFWNYCPESEVEDWWYMPSQLESDLRKCNLFCIELTGLDSFTLHIDESLGVGGERIRDRGEGRK
jgi:hypothetical protein